MPSLMIHHRHWLAALAIETALSACAPAPPTNSDVTSSDASADVVVPSAVTWSEHVAPIVFQHCASCHRSGGIAPFSLTEFAQAHALAAPIATATQARTMPPTLVDNSGACNAYDPHTVDWLSDQEIATLRAWADQGAPEGDPSRTPAVPPAPGGLARIDARLTMAAPFMPDATRMDEIRCFVVDAPAAQDRFVTGFQVEPGDARVVHHVIVYALETAAGQQTVTDLDARDARAGYDCPGGSMAASYPVVLWAPGGGATALPATTGLRIVGGRKLVMQVHYNLAQGVFADQTRVALQLETRVDREARMTAISAPNLNLPPRMPDVRGEGSRTMPTAGGPFKLWGVAPHMHTLGTDMQLSLRGQNRCAMDLHHWNFHWQRLFFYQSPLSVNGGETLDVRCNFDTSSKNEVTRWGEGTSDEMCIVYGYFTAQ